MTHRRLAIALLAGMLIAIAGCGSARRGVPLIGDREITDPVLLLGRRVFDANCHQCHPGGTAGLGLAINNKPFPKWLIKLQVRTGGGAMPAFSRDELSSEELDAVAEYLVWLRRLPPVEAGNQPPRR